MVLVYGTVCIDRFLQVARFPELGGYVEVEQETIALGGEAANSAIALARWGVEVELVANSIGDDPNGRELIRLAADAGLPPLRQDPSVTRTPLCEIVVTPDGERTMFGHGFREMRPSVGASEIGFKPGEWFSAEPNMAEPARDAVAAADRAGMRCYLMDFVEADETLPSGCYWQSSTDWCGARDDRRGNTVWLEDWIASKGCFGILSDGPHGTFAGSPTSAVRHYQAFPAPVVVDATGAGDLFRAAMLFALGKGWDTSRCLRFAAAAGSLKCRHLGATADVPSVAEIERHIEAYPGISESYR